MSRGNNRLLTLAVSWLAASSLVLSVTPATAEPAILPDPVADLQAPTVGGGGSVEVSGHGYGHGRGLSQYGAQRAARRGRSHREILSYYYPRTRLGKVGGTIAVAISGDTGDDLVVKARRGLSVRSLGQRKSWRLRKPAARKWRITPLRGGARSRVAWRGTSGGWRTWRRVRGDAEFAAGGAPVRLLGAAGPRSYRGRLRSASDDGGRTTVNVVPLEHYLRGVVPLEVPALWEPAAVRAQAVAARTYAASERRTSNEPAYDLCDTAHCQVYGGVSAEHSASNAAIRQTRRQAVVKRGKPIFAQFNASSGGWTVDGGRPYLVAKQDRYDDWGGNPYHDWTTTLTASAIEAQWPGIGNLQRIRVLERDGNGDWGGRVLRMRLEGSSGNVTIDGDTFRVRFGLRSTWFRLTTDL